MSANGWSDMQVQFRRVCADLGPGKMAERIGVDRVTVWRWEQGKRTPRRSSMLMIVNGMTIVANPVGEPGEGNTSSH